MSNEREERLFASLIYLADTLVTGFDVVDLADRLMAACQDLLPVSAAGIMLDDQNGGLHVLASSSEEMRLLELLEIQSDEGPCLTAFSTGEIVRADDLSAAVDEWPQFVPTALAQGFRSAYALPMRLRDRTIGALNLFSKEISALADRDLRVAQVLTSMSAIGLLNHRAVRRHELLAEQLQIALNSRIVIEQAKGVIAEHTGLDMGDAFALLRSSARAWRRPLSDVAADIARGDHPSDPTRGVQHRPTPIALTGGPSLTPVLFRRTLGRLRFNDGVPFIWLATCVSPRFIWPRPRHHSRLASPYESPSSEARHRPAP